MKVQTISLGLQLCSNVVLRVMTCSDPSYELNRVRNRVVALAKPYVDGKPGYLKSVAVHGLIIRVILTTYPELR